MNHKLTLAALILCVVALLAPCATIHGQSATQTTTQEPATPADKNLWLRMSNNGAWWNTLTRDSKADFVDGYVSAMASVHQMLIGLVKKNSKELTPGPQFDTQMNEILGLSVLAERYEFGEVPQAKLLAGMDGFYKEPLNKLIAIDFAFLHVRDTLNGKVAPRDLQKELDEWRAIVNK
jgi:hypothetical protein